MRTSKPLEHFQGASPSVVEHVPHCELLLNPAVHHSFLAREKCCQLTSSHLIAFPVHDFTYCPASQFFEQTVKVCASAMSAMTWTSRMSTQYLTAADMFLPRPFGEEIDYSWPHLSSARHPSYLAAVPAARLWRMERGILRVTQPCFGFPWITKMSCVSSLFLQIFAKLETPNLSILGNP